MLATQTHNQVNSNFSLYNLMSTCQCIVLMLKSLSKTLLNNKTNVKLTKSIIKIEKSITVIVTALCNFTPSSKTSLKIAISVTIFKLLLKSLLYTLIIIVICDLKKVHI